VNQERPTAIEPNNQILAAPIDGGHTLAMQGAGDGCWIERPGEAWIPDLHVIEPPAAQERVELGADRLDFG
jgi:hypothetical protein